MSYQVKHVGYVVDEMAGAVVPFASAYARRGDAERAAREEARSRYGIDPTACEVFPASREEEARELVEWVALDSEARAWQVLPQMDIEPGRGRADAEGHRDHYAEPAYLPAMTADAAIDALAADGWTARYSKGGNLWVLDAGEGDDMRPYGLRWSAKRGQWWAKLDQGRAVMTQYTRRGQTRAA